MVQSNFLYQFAGFSIISNFSLDAVGDLCQYPCVRYSSKSYCDPRADASGDWRKSCSLPGTEYRGYVCATPCSTLGFNYYWCYYSKYHWGYCSPGCGDHLEGKYFDGDYFQSIPDSSLADCKTSCENEPTCTRWTWTSAWRNDVARNASCALKRGAGNLLYFGGYNPRVVSSMLCRQETTENGCKLKNGTSVMHGWNGTIEANGCQDCECADGTLYCRECRRQCDVGNGTLVDPGFLLVEEDRTCACFGNNTEAVSSMKCTDRAPQRVDILSSECQVPLGSSVSTSFDDGEHHHCSNCTCQSGGVLSCQPKRCQQEERKPCYLTDGRQVSDHFVGLDSGEGYCNLCQCENGVLECIECNDNLKLAVRLSSASKLQSNGSN